MADLLEEICERKRAHIQKAKEGRPFAVLAEVAHRAARTRGFEAALRERSARAGVGLIAEIKKASPSAGLIREDFSSTGLARIYEEAGAACLSVLTDEPYFQGRNEDLSAARQASRLPVLRKDFMLDIWQVAEARALGADCILIIMAAVDDATADGLRSAAQAFNMDVLIECHNKRELERALKLSSGLIGINNRDLKTLKVDLAVTEELAPLVPSDRVVVSESGIRDASDIGRLRQAGVSSFLVGESLLRQGNVGEAARTLLGR